MGDLAVKVCMPVGSRGLRRQGVMQMKAKGPFLSAALMVVAGAAMLTGAMAQQQPDAAIYGSQLMTTQERLQYREQLRQARTTQEREQIRAQHHREMQKRARRMGVSLPGTVPVQPARARQRSRATDIYGSEMMTTRERLRYRERLRNARTEKERQQIRLQHRELMRQRARDWGLPRPDVMEGRQRSSGYSAAGRGAGQGGPGAGTGGASGGGSGGGAGAGGGGGAN